MNESPGVASGSATVRLWATESGQLVRSLSLCATTTTSATVIEGLSSSSSAASASSASASSSNSSSVHVTHDNNDNSSNVVVDDEDYTPSPTPTGTAATATATLPPHLLIQLQWVARAPVHTTMACGGTNIPGGNNTGGGNVALGLGAVWEEGTHGWLAAASSAGVTLWM